MNDDAMNREEGMEDEPDESRLKADALPSAQPSPGDMQSERSRREAEVEKELRTRTRRAFLVGGAAAVAGVLGWRWLLGQPAVDGTPAPFRSVLDFNEKIARAYFSDGNLAPTFTRADVVEPFRINGGIGLPGGFDPSTWQLTVKGETAGERTLTIDDIKSLPRVELIAEFKCIEGWSQIVGWAGARFSDFVERYAPATRSGQPVDRHKRRDDLLRYVAMSTPDRGYYVGLDIESAMHPQTLLAYEMNGRPLTLEHGAPLRLVIPVKYGVKNIKRIGTIAFTDMRPEDYWAKQGYDWFAGL